MGSKPARVRKPSRKKAAGEPASAMMEKLAHEYLKDRNAYAAAIRAGYSESVAKKKSGDMIKAMMPTIEKLQQRKNEIMLKRGIMSQDEILASMSNIGRVNPMDYITVIPRQVGGELVVGAKLKDFTELTREQADAVEVFEERGIVKYKLPGITERMSARAFLGKHWGLTDPKLVSLRISQSMSLDVDMRGVDSALLEEFEQKLIEALGPTARRMLGYRDAEEQEPIEHEADDED